MNPSEFKADASYWEKVRRAQAMTPEERVREGFRLFDEERRAVALSFRQRFPEATEEDVHNMVNEEYRKRREKKDEGVFFPVHFIDVPPETGSQSFPPR